MINETHLAAATLSLDEHRPICERCGRGKLDLIYERGHPVLGIAGVICRTLKCNAVECGALTFD
jgi:uncharacterized cysteine cluster protein YcgN (CxxCxxCC family)